MTENNEEKWAPVVGYEGLYEVSSHGRARSLDHVTVTSHGITRRYRGRILRQSYASLDGRPSVRISREGVMRTYTVASLVAEAFLGPRPPGMYVLHADDVPYNNALSNLRYGTPAENAMDKTLNGGHDSMQKDACVRGHLLAEPNLVRSSRKRFVRNCLACSRANTYVQNHPWLDMQSTSDAYYAAILRKVAV